MATVTLRVDDRTKEDLDALARSRSTTISDLLRSLIDELTGRATKEPGAYPVHLTLVERRILSMQHEILGKLDPDLVDIHRRRSEVLDAGYAAEYSDEFLAVDPGLSARDCELVHDLLDMFTVLGPSLDKLDPAVLASIGEDAVARLAFSGFDANDALESRMLAYAKYLIETDRWTNLAGHFKQNDSGNSHWRNLPTYQRMLEAYTPLYEAKVKRGFGPDHHLLDAGELAVVAQAVIHPDNR
jgi:uncharacterized protein YfbU (UPF0304 family)